MITTDQISNPILGFNAIKHIAQTTDDKLLTELFHSSFNRSDVYKIEAFVILLQPADSVEATVRVKGTHTVVPPGCIIHVPCKHDQGFSILDVAAALDPPLKRRQSC